MPPRRPLAVEDGGAAHLALQGLHRVHFPEVPHIFRKVADFAIGPSENGESVIRKLDLSNGQFVETVFEQEGAKAQSLLVDAYTNTPIGVTYMDGTPGQMYFHQEMQVVQRTIDKAVPDASNRVVSTSSDRRQVLVYSESAEGPGAYYLWNRDAKSFQTIGQAMQNWGGEFLNEERPVSYVAQEDF